MRFSCCFFVVPLFIFSSVENILPLWWIYAYAFIRVFGVIRMNSTFHIFYTRRHKHIQTHTNIHFGIHFTFLVRPEKFILNEPHKLFCGHSVSYPISHLAWFIFEYNVFILKGFLFSFSLSFLLFFPRRKEKRETILCKCDEIHFFFSRSLTASYSSLSLLGISSTVVVLFFVLCCRPWIHFCH